MENQGNDFNAGLFDALRGSILYGNNHHNQQATLSYNNMYVNQGPLVPSHLAVSPYMHPPLEPPLQPYFGKWMNYCYYYF